MKVVGVILVLIGVVAVLYGGLRIAYPDRVIDAGPLEVSVTKHEKLPVPPILGAVALVGGMVILASGARET